MYSKSKMRSKDWNMWICKLKKKNEINDFRIYLDGISFSLINKFVLLFALWILNEKITFQMWSGLNLAMICPNCFCTNFIFLFDVLSRKIKRNSIAVHHRSHQPSPSNIVPRDDISHFSIKLGAHTVTFPGFHKWRCNAKKFWAGNYRPSRRQRPRTS